MYQRTRQYFCTIFGSRLKVIITGSVKTKERNILKTTLQRTLETCENNLTVQIDFKIHYSNTLKFFLI